MADWADVSWQGPRSEEEREHLTAEHQRAEAMLADQERALQDQAVAAARREQMQDSVNEVAPSMVGDHVQRLAHMRRNPGLYTVSQIAEAVGNAQAWVEAHHCPEYSPYGTPTIADIWADDGDDGNDGADQGRARGLTG